MKQNNLIMDWISCLFQRHTTHHVLFFSAAERKKRVRISASIECCYQISSVSWANDVRPNGDLFCPASHPEWSGLIRYYSCFHLMKISYTLQRFVRLLWKPYHFCRLKIMWVGVTCKCLTQGKTGILVAAFRCFTLFSCLFSGDCVAINTDLFFVAGEKVHYDRETGERVVETQQSDFKNDCGWDLSLNSAPNTSNLYTLWTPVPTAVRMISLSSDSYLIVLSSSSLLTSSTDKKKRYD